MISETKNMKINEVRIIFLDKNHPIGGINNATKLIDQKMPGGVEYSKIYLIPKVENDLI